MDDAPSRTSNVPPVLTFEQSLDLTEAACGRICHDLAGPVGALTGTLELALSGDEEAASLAMELAALLSSRLMLLRAAWGGGEAPPVADPAALQAGLPGAERLRVEAAGLPQDLPDSLRRMVPSLLLMAASALPRGGTITLGFGPAEINVGIAGVGGAWPQSLAACAASPGSCLAAPGGPRGVAVPLACLGAHRLGLTLDVPSATEMTLTMPLPIG